MCIRDSHPRPQRLPAPRAPTRRAAARLMARLLIPVPQPPSRRGAQSTSPRQIAGLEDVQRLPRKRQRNGKVRNGLIIHFTRKKKITGDNVELSPRACLYLKNQNFLEDVGREGTAPGGSLEGARRPAWRGGSPTERAWPVSAGLRGLRHPEFPALPRSLLPPTAPRGTAWPSRQAPPSR